MFRNLTPLVPINLSILGSDIEPLAGWSKFRPSPEMLKCSRRKRTRRIISEKNGANKNNITKTKTMFSFKSPITIKRNDAKSR
jgi:hypothetical protein